MKKGQRLTWANWTTAVVDFFITGQCSSNFLLRSLLRLLRPVVNLLRYVFYKHLHGFYAAVKKSTTAVVRFAQVRSRVSVNVWPAIFPRIFVANCFLSLLTMVKHRFKKNIAILRCTTFEMFKSFTSRNHSIRNECLHVLPDLWTRQPFDDLHGETSNSWNKYEKKH